MFTSSEKETPSDKSSHELPLHTLKRWDLVQLADAAEKNFPF
jgi:hypothetical protein